MTPAPPQTMAGNLPGALCDCVGDCSTCLHTTFCMACRVGHTMHVAGICDFWTATLTWHFCTCIRCCLGIHWRGQLRSKLGVKGSCCDDLLAYCCCSPCAVGQDAMVVDKATGAKVSCCCNLELTGPPPLQGTMNDQTGMGQPPVVT